MVAQSGRSRPGLARAQSQVLMSAFPGQAPKSGRPASVALVETSYGGLEEDSGGPSERGWRLVLHEERA